MCRLISDPSSRITFGKHRDHTIQYVLENDPAYIVWAHRNVSFFKVSQDILEQARDAARERRSDGISGWVAGYGAEQQVDGGEDEHFSSFHHYGWGN